MSAPPRRWLLCIGYIASTVTIAIGVYYACYRNVRPGISFLTWICSSSQDAHFRYSAAGILGSNANSYVKLFLGGKLSFLRQYMSIPTMVSLCVAAIAIVYAIWVFRRKSESAVLPRSTDSANGNELRFILISWLVPYVLFLSFWLPWNGFYKLFLWPPLVLFLGTVVDKSRRYSVYGAIALVIGMTGWNFAAYIFPHFHDSADPVLLFSKKIDAQLPKNAVLYYQAFVTDDWYLDYFAPGRQWTSLPILHRPEEMMALLSSSSPVCLETSALSEIASRGKAWQDALTSKLSNQYRWNLISSKYNVRVRCAAATPLNSSPQSSRALNETPR